MTELKHVKKKIIRSTALPLSKNTGQNLRLVWVIYVYYALIVEFPI